MKATDQGEPSLEGVCSFTVEITDVNDNPPLFDRQVSKTNSHLIFHMCSKAKLKVNNSIHKIHFNQFSRSVAFSIKHFRIYEFR